jgi:hypothetical protein
MHLEAEMVAISVMIDICHMNQIAQQAGFLIKFAVFVKPVKFKNYAALIFLTMIQAGCFWNDRGLAPVSGTIFFKGAPLANAGINFIPEDHLARVAIGSTDKEGKYKLTSFQINDGAKVGKYKVTIRAEEGGDSDKKRSDALDFVRGKIITPLRYANPETSGLIADVLNSKNVINFELSE